jgi:hypothetical protein
VVIKVNTVTASPTLHADPVAATADVADEVEAAAVDEVKEKFLALVCADEELLRAEFDAIIAAAWDQPTPPTRPRPTRRPPGPPAPRRERRVDASAGGSPGQQHYPAGEGRRQQRAPPGPRPPGKPATDKRARKDGRKVVMPVSVNDHFR